MGAQGKYRRAVSTAVVKPRPSAHAWAQATEEATRCEKAVEAPPSLRPSRISKQVCIVKTCAQGWRTMCEKEISESGCHRWCQASPIGKHMRS